MDVEISVVPVLAGRELIFFIVAGIRLCFGVVMKTVLVHTNVLVIAEQSLHTLKACSVSHTALPVSRLGMVRSWVGTQTGQLTQTGQRDIPYHMTSSQQ